EGGLAYTLCNGPKQQAIGHTDIGPRDQRRGPFPQVLLIILGRHQVMDEVEEWSRVTFNWTNVGRLEQVDYLFPFHANPSALAARIVFDGFRLSGEMLAQCSGNIHMCMSKGRHSRIELIWAVSSQQLLVDEFCRCDGVPPFLDKFGSQPSIR